MEKIGESGYSGSDWSTCTVQEIWAKISNQTTESYWTIISGWRKSHELTGDHLVTVQRYKENLVQAWPPDKSPAAQAYLDRLDQLLKHLQNTYESAVANERALTSVATTLSDARSRIEPLTAEYLANEAAITKYASEKSHFKMSSPKSVPGPPSPVAAGRQEAISAEARRIMYETGAGISAARTKLVQPQQFDPDSLNNDPNQKSAQEDPPVLAPVTPFHSTPGGSAPFTQTAHAGTAGNQGMGYTISGSGLPSADPPGARHPGLVLGGAQVQPTLPPQSTGIGPLPTTGSNSIPLPNGIIPSTPLRPITSGGSPFGPQGSPAVGRRGLVTEPFAKGSSPGRVMPPGGVIGGQPGVGLTQPANGGRQAQRINPAGGMLNPNNQAARRGGSSMAGQQAGVPQGRNGRRNQDAETRSWDPDNPWETAEGVAPVLLPVKEQRIDPGPAIGLDR